MSPDSRRHRGAHPEDRKLFAAEKLAALRAATDELSWLLCRDYPVRAALKLVGDRHGLTDRQRVAVSRAACSDASRELRQARRVDLAAVPGAELAIDGFNLLITVEAALSGAVLLRCRDGCLRDMASIHGSYRSVEETEPAIRKSADVLAALRPASVRWLLDRPISNSGRLAERLRSEAETSGWPWTVEAVFNPDTELIEGTAIVVSSDSVVLDGASHWVDLASAVLKDELTGGWLVDLSDEGPAEHGYR